MKLRVLSYNIHGCVDSQRRLNIINILNILDSLKADIIALQEVDTEKPISRNMNQARMISDFLGMDYSYFPIEKIGRHAFGLAILCHYPIKKSDCSLLPNLYPRLKMRKRGVMQVRLQTPRGNIHLINTHLSVYKLERHLQLVSVLGWNRLHNISPTDPFIFCGDLNSNPTSLTYRILSRYFNDVQKRPMATRKPQPTFPSKFPIFRIDHILISSHFKLIHTEVIKNSQTMNASDHLPLVADLRLTEKINYPLRLRQDSLFGAPIHKWFPLLHELGYPLLHLRGFANLRRLPNAIELLTHEKRRGFIQQYPLSSSSTVEHS